MIIVHNGKTLGIKQDAIKSMTERDFIRAHKHINIFTDKELSEIYKQAGGRNSTKYDELK
jgi:hypothetical protein